MTIDKYTILTTIWGLWFLFWAVLSLKVKRISNTESRASRIFHLALTCGVFALILTNDLHNSFLGWRFIPDTVFSSVIGIGVLLSGFFLAIWSRTLLGQNWSAIVSIKKDHELIQHGPYRLVRHPIYTAFVTGLLGSAILIGEVRGIIATVLLLIAYLRKLKLEEQILTHHFGDTYLEYKKTTKAIIPFIL